MTPDILARLQRVRAAGTPVVLATSLPEGEQLLLPEDGASAALRDAARIVLRQDKSAVADIEGQNWFLHAYNPPLRLVVIGAVHIAQALVPMAAQLGFGVTVVDPRRSLPPTSASPTSPSAPSGPTRRWTRSGPTPVPQS